MRYYALCAGAELRICRSCSRLDTRPENVDHASDPHQPRVQGHTRGEQCADWRGAPTVQADAEDAA